MAYSPGMVPTTTRYKVIAVVAVIAVIGIYIFTSDTPIPAPLYSASDSESDLAVVDGITRADNHTSSSSIGTIRAVVVPHHLVASEAIALGIKSLIPSSPRLIVIISPDHFSRCSKILCTTKGSYKTFFGDVQIDDQAVEQILLHSDIAEASDLFKGEHGIYAIVPFIKHYIPQAMIVPVALSQQGVGTEEIRKEIIGLIEQLLKEKDVALVISSDFSHYLPLQESNEMDAKTQTSFCSGNSQEILALKNPSQSDCPICLWILRQEAELGGFWNPSLIWHSNSATLLHDLSVQETTSHFSFILSDTSSSDSCTRMF